MAETAVIPSAAMSTNTREKSRPLPAELLYIQYSHAHEKQYLPSIRALISKDLSEPYSIYVYRYFLYQWGDLCFMVRLLSRYFSTREFLWPPRGARGIQKLGIGADLET